MLRRLFVPIVNLAIDTVIFTLVLPDRVSRVIWPCQSILHAQIDRTGE